MANNPRDVNMLSRLSTREKQPSPNKMHIVNRNTISLNSEDIKNYKLKQELKSPYDSMYNTGRG